jgi:peptide deformylase
MILKINNAFKDDELKILLSPTQDTYPIIDKVDKDPEKQEGRWLPEIIEFINNMKETLKSNENGVALASNQVWSKPEPCPSIFVMKDLEKDTIEEFINPVVKGSGGSKKKEEGCLSIPGLVIMKRRKKNATVVYQTLDSPLNKCIIKFGGLYSQAVQHEYDHLRGTLIRKITDEIRSRKQS